MTVRPSRGSIVRSGYTLLEMTLALMIALIILGAIYEFLNRQITMAEIGRELVEESHLVRGIMDKMAKDIVGSLGAVDPQQLPDTTDPTEAALTGETFTPLFNSGVDGTNSVLILSISRVPMDLLAPDKRNLDSNSLKKVCDLRRTSYWFVDDGNNTGLACQELKDITSDEFNNRPPDVGDPATMKILAPEVRSLMFEYFDGVGWQSFWSGNTMASDGVTPMGPPAAIRITLTVGSKDGLRTREYRRVVALPAGNNFQFQQSGL